MLKTRVIPCLLLKGQGLVKTIRFKDPTYIGDPINAVKIFNEKEVDELTFLDITATIEKRSPNFQVIRNIASECFMPLGYGGGITRLSEIDTLFSIGIEKVIINSALLKKDSLLTDASIKFGSQSIVASIDVKKKFWGKNEVYINSGKVATGIDAAEYAKRCEQAGAGEILLNSIDRDGTMKGYDTDLLKKITSNVSIPVIACGGAGNTGHFSEAVTEGGASAVAAGSMFVFQGIHRAVLISYPSYKVLEETFNA